MKKPVYIHYGAMLIVILLHSISPASAQQSFDEGRMQVIQALEEVLVAGGDKDAFIEERLEPSYRNSMSRASMKDHLRSLSQAVSNSQALDINAEPNAVHLIFSDGASATITVQFDSDNPSLIKHIGFRKEKSRAEMTPSERLAAAQRTRMKAIEALGNASKDQQFETFLENHVSPTFLSATSKEDLLSNLRLLQTVIARSGVIMFETSSDGSRLKFRGPENADVLFMLDPNEPHLITSLVVDTNVDTSEEEEAKASIDPITWNNLEQRLAEEARAGFSGVVMAVRNGQVVLNEGYGYADKETGRLNTPSTLFGIGSIPIDFTIASIFKLDDDGALSLSDPISTFFPDAPVDKSSITLNQLMTGQSGLPNFHSRPDIDTDYDLDWIDRAEAIDRILNQPLLFAPGEQRSHSHSAFVLLAAIVEIVSGSSYPDYLRTTFFNPMQMTHTGFYGETDRFEADQFAVGYGYRAVSDKNIPLNWGPTSWLVMGSGGMVSTVEDLYTWIKEIRSGDYLSLESLKRYTAGGVASGISDRGFMTTYINDPQNTIIYLSNTVENEGDLSMVLGETLVRMALNR